MGFDLADAPICREYRRPWTGQRRFLVSQVLDSKYVGASCRGPPIRIWPLVPMIQPVVIKAMTTKKERRIRMEYHPAQVTKAVALLSR